MISRQVTATLPADAAAQGSACWLVAELSPQSKAEHEASG